MPLTRSLSLALRFVALLLIYKFYTVFVCLSGVPFPAACAWGKSVIFIIKFLWIHWLCLFLFSSPLSSMHLSLSTISWIRCNDGTNWRWIEAASGLVEGRYGHNQAKLIYGTFTTPTNAIAGSAICAFSLQVRTNIHYTQPLTKLTTPQFTSIYNYIERYALNIFARIVGGKKLQRISWLLSILWLLSIHEWTLAAEQCAAIQRNKIK